jgi:hypothetical protein
MSEQTAYGTLGSSEGGHRAAAAMPNVLMRVRQCSPVVTLRPASLRRNSLVAIALSAAVATLAACGGEEAPSAERFCGEVAANKEALTNPQLVYTDDIEPLLDLYRTIGDLAPLGVEQDWNDIVSAYETASTVVVGDQESEQAALTAAYSIEKSAAAVETWLMANCAVDIGPVFTIVPQGPVTITAPPSDTAVAPSVP